MSRMNIFQHIRFTATLKLSIVLPDVYSDITVNVKFALPYLYNILMQKLKLQKLIKHFKHNFGTVKILYTSFN